MKILLIYPNNTGYSRVPMGLSLIYTCLSEKGHDIRIYDTTFCKLFDQSDDAIRESLLMVRKSNLSDYVTYEDKSIQNVKSELNELVLRFQPQLIGFTILEDYAPFALELAAEIKVSSPESSIIFGGLGVTMSPHEIIDHPAVDMICLGEGEMAVVELVEKIDNNQDYSNVSNIWIKKNNNILKNDLGPLPDLNTIPFVNLTPFDDRHFYRPFSGKIYRTYMYEHSRGCPRKCSYCNNPTLQKLYKHKGKYLRRKSIDRSIEELSHLKDKYNLGLIFFIDDDFALMPIDEFEKFLIAYSEKVALPFIAQIFPDDFTEEKARLIKKHGCLRLRMSIESGSPYIREKVFNRKSKNENIIRTFHLAHKYGISISAANIIGNPYESRNELMETIELNRKCKPVDITVNFLTPYKGTPIRDMCIELGYIRDSDSIDMGFRGDPLLNMPQISKKELIGIRKTFPLYCHLPRWSFGLVRIAEGESVFSNMTFGFLVSWFKLLRRIR